MSVHIYPVDINGREDLPVQPRPQIIIRRKPFGCLFISFCLCPALYGFGPLLLIGSINVSSARDIYEKDHQDLERQQAVIAQCPQTLNLTEVSCQDLAQTVIANPRDVVFICGRYCPPLDTALLCASMFRGFRWITVKSQSEYPGYLPGLIMLAVGLPLSCLICAIACYIHHKGLDEDW